MKSRYCSRLLFLTVFVVMFPRGSLATQAHQQDGCSELGTGIRANIEQVGAKKELYDLYYDKSKWIAFRVCVAHGEREWLVLARVLHDVADAGPRSEIPLSVGEALRHSPETVLKHLADNMDEERFAFIDVCQGPDIDDERFDGLELALNEIENRMKSLRSISKVDLMLKRDRCLALLEKSMVDVHRFYGGRH